MQVYASDFSRIIVGTGNSGYCMLVGFSIFLRFASDLHALHELDYFQLVHVTRILPLLYNPNRPVDNYLYWNVKSLIIQGFNMAKCSIRKI